MSDNIPHDAPRIKPEFQTQEEQEANFAAFAPKEIAEIKGITRSRVDIQDFLIIKDYPTYLDERPSISRTYFIPSNGGFQKAEGIGFIKNGENGKFNLHNVFKYSERSRNGINIIFEPLSDDDEVEFDVFHRKFSLFYENPSGKINSINFRRPDSEIDVESEEAEFLYIDLESEDDFNDPIVRLFPNTGESVRLEYAPDKSSIYLTYKSRKEKPKGMNEDEMSQFERDFYGTEDAPQYDEARYSIPPIIDRDKIREALVSPYLAEDPFGADASADNKWRRADLLKVVGIEKLDTTPPESGNGIALHK